MYLGTGCGTTPIPVLPILGYQPPEIVRAVLLSEPVSEVMAGLFRHEFGSVNLKPGPRDIRSPLSLPRHPPHAQHDRAEI